MKNIFLPICLFLSLVHGGTALAQEATPAPTEVRDTTVNVNVPAPAEPAPAPAPAPDVNVRVEAPAPAAAPVVNTEKTTKETSVTKTVETPAPQDNTMLLVVGGCIGVLALGALVIASKNR